jgi:hypothetical protein
MYSHAFFLSCRFFLAVGLFMAFAASTAFCQEKADPADKATAPDFIFGLGEVTPPWSMGPEATFLAFPFKIPIGGGRYNLMGFGATAGYYINFDDGPAGWLRLCGLFDGRMNFSESVQLDMDAGLGILSADGGSAFLGTFGIGLPIRLSPTLRIRPYVGMDFAANPAYDPSDYYSKEFIKWLHASVCLMIRTR